MEEDGEAKWKRRFTMMVLIPMTSPSRLTRGPPELPGEMVAFVWMYSLSWEMGVVMLRDLLKKSAA